MTQEVLQTIGVINRYDESRQPAVVRVIGEIASDARVRRGVSLVAGDIKRGWQRFVRQNIIADEPVQAREFLAAYRDPQPDSHFGKVIK
jgi:hypothetical protein